MRREAALWPGVALAVMLALFAFVLSFDALRTVGLACGIRPMLAWMFPLIIDGSTLAFTWAAWAFKTRAMPTAYPWSMLVLFSLISLVGNALHAGPVQVGQLLLPQWAASLIMTVPPVALLATTHMIVMAAARSRDLTETVAADGADEPEPPTAPDPDPEPLAAFAEPETATPASEPPSRLGQAWSDAVR